MTPSREEYLYKLQDLSEHSHTSNYIAEVIGEVIEKIGSNKISAIMSDNASNVQNTCKIIEEKYPNIENVRCIAHAVNLIACDILKESFGDHLLRKVNTLASFFKNSHQAGAKLIQLIKENSIHGGGIKLYCKTRWTTASESVNSVIRLEPVLEQIITNESNLLNDRVKRVLQRFLVIVFYHTDHFTMKPTTINILADGVLIFSKPKNVYCRFIKNNIDQNICINSRPVICKTSTRNNF